MSTRRRHLAVLGVGTLLAAFPALAQQQVKIRRIGFLAERSRSTLSNPEIYYDAFVQGMLQLGYVEGKNLVIEWRFADGKPERLPGLATELVQMKVEVIVSHGTPGTRAARQATNTIPIVFAAAGDPVASGFAASLARPGGNITGLSLMGPDVSPKQLELLKTMLPTMSRLAVLVNAGNPGNVASLESVRAAARRIGIMALSVDAGTTEEIERAFTVMVRERADAVIGLAGPFFTGQRQPIVDLASKHRLPMMYGQREYVKAGGLMSYGPSFADLYRRAATHVDKILKGARPDQLPFEQPTNFHLAINRKTAKALGLAIPQDLMVRANEVID